MKINEKLQALILAEDAKLNKRHCWNSNDIARNVNALLTFRWHEVGWRNSCGVTDITTHINRSWLKVIKELRKQGYKISEEVVKHGNAYATSKGGFWSSIIYRLDC